MADDKIKLTLHVNPSRREARDLWLQLSKIFGQEQKVPDEIPINVCPRCGGFKRGIRVCQDMLCFRCEFKTSKHYRRELRSDRR
jgi:hypothetical protein